MSTVIVTHEVGGEMLTDPKELCQALTYEAGINIIINNKPSLCEEEADRRYPSTPTYETAAGDPEVRNSAGVGIISDDEASSQVVEVGHRGGQEVNRLGESNRDSVTPVGVTLTGTEDGAKENMMDVDVNTDGYQRVKLMYTAPCYQDIKGASVDPTARDGEAERTGRRGGGLDSRLR